ncbi:uncharacterized protein SPPG_06927 [Spizellomyces punctatus DAOM BR117]|uniref:Uncharacterized protein n=1 Tax=Spizellomyces punctatus (strain DAOM BR117) TaxID=645134 RepID=A0A0L0HAL7_SPIPD|nr:uncharacterized protein SPPG_06927 [Spizellomyces punctatus DAOM BR117]KNC97939.1 hypothetical protein SPPG_06927 [Spizellomyces punctatus DAOM BR117]|eukprot:XP_016605979.1 hypothetical protein SPPG_06927 [Spizellomyces punctatus DAOM BR117]
MSLSTTFQGMSLDENGALQPSPETMAQPATFKTLTMYLLFKPKQNEHQGSYIGLCVEPMGELFKISARGFQDPSNKNVTLDYFQPTQYIGRIDRIFQRVAGRKNRFAKCQLNVTFADDIVKMIHIPEESRWCGAGGLWH